MHLLLVEAPPHERARRRGHLPHRPRAHAHHTDQLLAGIDVPLPDRSAPTRVLRWRSRVRPGPGRGGGSAANSSLNQSSGIERGIRFGGWADSAPPVRSSTVHRVVVLMRPAGTTRQVQRERVDQRAGPRVEMDVVDASQHRLAVRDGGRSASGAGRRLACHRVRATGGPKPPGRSAPRDAHCLQRTPPPEQIHAVGADRRRRSPPRLPPLAQREHPHPDVPAAQRRERARVRGEKGVRWGGRSLAVAA